MKANVIVNPLAAVEPADESGDLISCGPVPGRGMRFLRLSPNEQPRLHSLFSELLSVGINTLDPAVDLEPEEMSLLEEHGILISPDNIPERPLFACMLDDVEPDPDPPSELIINSTLEFQPFDLTEFRSLLLKHLSPHHARVWVTDPGTGARWGYWLSPKDAEVIARMTPGSPIGEGLDAAMTAKLSAAAILIDSRSGSRCNESHLAAAADYFASNRYAIIDGIVPSAQLRSLQNYYRRYVEQGFMKFGDRQVPLRFAEYREHVASILHNGFTQIMSTITGVPVVPTYSYVAVYTEGAVLEPHVDQEACEFSFSFQLEFWPEPADGISPWPLYISSNSPDDLDVHPEKDNAVHLANGSLLAYKGRELVHYRTALPAGNRSASVFFHYVPD